MQRPGIYFLSDYNDVLTAGRWVTLSIEEPLFLGDYYKILGRVDTLYLRGLTLSIGS